MSISAGRVTRLGISGSVWRPAGDFTGKGVAPIFSGTIPDITATEGDVDLVTDLSGYFSGATSYSISPVVEAGWTFNTSTGVLTTDSDLGTFGTYVVTGTNATGSDDSNAFSVIVSSSSSPTGGFWPDYDREQDRRRRERDRLLALEKKAEAVKDDQVLSQRVWLARQIGPR